ncbi:hypothetical protein PYK79_38695 [Streptomyces sp. ID05-04B]|nr:hypothetical protein [Streptomyces sp. ID05-04B]
MLVGPDDGGVDVEVPGDQLFRVGLGLEFGEDPKVLVTTSLPV